MRDYWIITEHSASVETLYLHGFSYSSGFKYGTTKVHICLVKKIIFPFYDSEEPGDYDIYIKDFDINKYNQLSLLVSLGIPIEEAFKEIE